MEWQPIETAKKGVRVWLAGRYETEPRDWWYAWACPEWHSIAAGEPTGCRCRNRPMLPTLHPRPSYA
jgi:hypothetical protein